MKINFSYLKISGLASFFFYENKTIITKENQMSGADDRIEKAED